MHLERKLQSFKAYLRRRRSGGRFDRLWRRSPGSPWQGASPGVMQCVCEEALQRRQAPGIVGGGDTVHGCTVSTVWFQRGVSVCV